MSLDLFRSLARKVLAGDDLRAFEAEVDAHQAAADGAADAPEPLDVPANTGDNPAVDDTPAAEPTHVATPVPAEQLPAADTPGTTSAPAETAPAAAEAETGQAPAPAGGVDEPGHAAAGDTPSA